MSRVHILKQIFQRKKSRQDHITRTIVRNNVTTSATKSNSWSITEIIVGDTKKAWQNAGFNVDEEDLVKLDNLKIRVNGGGGGLLGIVFGVTGEDNDVGSTNNLYDPPVIPGLSIFVEEQAKHFVSDKHPNTCFQLGELVLYSQNLYDTVNELQRVGVRTHKGMPPKEIKGGKHAVATFYLSNNLRLLLFGPIDPKHDRTTNPKTWMFGRSDDKDTVSLTGYLPICEDINRLHNSINGNIGKIKKALQKGRQIATLKDGTIKHLTGTFAFLSDVK